MSSKPTKQDATALVCLHLGIMRGEIRTVTEAKRRERAALSVLRDAERRPWKQWDLLRAKAGLYAALQVRRELETEEKQADVHNTPLGAI